MHTAWSPAEGLNNSSDLGTLGGLPGPGDRAVSTQNCIIRVNAPSGSGPARSTAASPIRGHKIDGVGTLDLMEVLGLTHLCTGRSEEEACGHIAGVAQSEGRTRGKGRAPGEGGAGVNEVGPVSICRPASRTSGGATPFVMGNVGGCRPNAYTKHPKRTGFGGPRTLGVGGRLRPARPAYLGNMNASGTSGPRGNDGPGPGQRRGALGAAEDRRPGLTLPRHGEP